MFTPGARVHVSDASPRGWIGEVLHVHRGALTVRMPNGGRTLVALERRRVTLVTS